MTTIAKQASAETTKTRQLTICNKYFPRPGRYMGHVIFPIISLSGKWLQESGFKAGQVISVNCEDRKLIITVVKECKYDDE
ncbi:MAG TPA: SymE family type I addiction module toxin [Sediminibacterium sp.]|nr:SymE family type I addiction module toxin [Sediminibacterium sp.]